MKHKDCGGRFDQFIAGGHYCYMVCNKCGFLWGDRKKIKQAVGNCHNFCCQPRRA